VYPLALPALALEPFANLAYVHLHRDSFSEKGDAAALKGDNDSREAALSTLGLRALKSLELSGQTRLDLSGSLGWQHNLSNTRAEEHLAFASGGTPFSVESTSLPRNAALVGAHASLALSRDLRLSLDYNGQLASREKNHGAGLSLNWQF
ncbi:autotransporter outer membrane beta-barrel domain-containing protein, partial [Pseudomonas chlororaphis]|uniref:autotransporter outer membrane beta-barrel domain-containing protein n=1 Tax=Pseudomonas chlororaphis TaxID=587753 RepID=UPI000F486F15